jgi:hypothetical protein
VISKSTINFLRFPCHGWIWLLVLLFSTVMPLSAKQDFLEKYRRIEQRTFDWAIAPGLGSPSSALQVRLGKALEELRIWLGSDSTRRPLLVLVAGHQGLNRALEQLGAAAVPRWVPAVALTSRAIVVVDLEHLIRNPGKGSATLVHELAHLVLEEAGGRLPRWVHEGIAQSVARQHPDPSTRRTLILLARRDELVPITDLDQVLPLDHFHASLLYAEALLFIDWTRRRFGENLHAGILERCQQGLSWSVGFEQVAGISIEQATEQWRQELASSPVFLGLVLDLILSWKGLALLVVIAALVQRFRRQARLKKMREEEQWNSPESPTSDGPNRLDRSDSTS